MILLSPVSPFSVAFVRALPHGLCAGIHLPLQPEPVSEDVLQRLLPEERATARSLRGFRQVQFAGGRLAMGLLFHELGVRRVPVLSNSDGAPDLPEGLSGSISHKQDLAIALLARGVGGLGVDLEETDRERPGVAAKVLRPEELEAVNLLLPERRWCDTIIRFSVKEAIYKAIHRYVRRYVGFEEVAVWPTPEGLDRVDFFLKGREGPFRMEARHTWVGDRVLSTVQASIGG